LDPKVSQTLQGSEVPKQGALKQLNGTKKRNIKTRTIMAQNHHFFSKFINKINF